MLCECDHLIESRAASKIILLQFRNLLPLALLDCQMDLNGLTAIPEPFVMCAWECIEGMAVFYVHIKLALAKIGSVLVTELIIASYSSISRASQDLDIVGCVRELVKPFVRHPTITGFVGMHTVYGNLGCRIIDGSMLIDQDQIDVGSG